MRDLIAEEVHICDYCDERMALTRDRTQWSCPACFIPKPRTPKKPVKLTDTHGQLMEGCESG